MSEDDGEVNGVHAKPVAADVPAVGREPGGRRRRGFTTLELLLVVGVGSAILAGSFGAYRTASEDVLDRENAIATAELLAAIRDKWRGIGSYIAVNNAAVINGGLLVQPYTYSGTTIYNGYQKAVSVFGATSMFTAVIRVPASKCLATVAALEPLAYKIVRQGGAIKEDPTTLLSSWDNNCGWVAPDGTVLLTAYVK